MQHDLVVEGLVVLPDGADNLQLGVSDGKIREIRKAGLKGERVVRAGKCLVFPGFIDGHVHLREPGWEYKEDFATGTAAAAHGGVTTVIDMPNNPTPATTVTVLKKKKELAASKGIVDVFFHGGVLNERVAELVSISDLVVGYKVYLAESTGGLTLPTHRLDAVLKAAVTTGRPLSLHCEDQAVIDSRTAALAAEKRPDLHCDLRPPEAEVTSVSAVISAATRIRKQRVNICHASVSRTVAMVNRARGRGLKVACEATLHHVFFTREAMRRNPMLKTNPPLRSEPDRASLIEGLRNAQVDFLVTDHAPHTREDKAQDGPSGVPGLDDYGHIVSWLLKAADFEPVTLARVCSANPATFYGLQDRGEVALGKRADFAIMDLHSPERASDANLKTKCGWTPYDGVEFPGRVRWTIRAGDVLTGD
ncbi:MAG TPA: dihydroorotase [Nitrososphaerales archaeon]|nr:dihydroorotase [Nitrososphaerales archaeon]